ncbi:hypothetical protein PA7_44890 [Pseudonocardia asaccharolytica DSM 44247 = NBRC 16224]|uniref:Uncharacterized protein n=1 Tax=Pseudonocardia asaccharolytica DSM 44247 = NBRC 16224 TaxID=1123024 RepID=A0A511D7C0_9PSEU|nr:hypothetical protein PA7_44890 [Pseudonocardia asaccharolytica DSM 44247 = NBRC 16224]
MPEAVVRLISAVAADVDLVGLGIAEYVPRDAQTLQSINAAWVHGLRADVGTDATARGAAGPPRCPRGPATAHPQEPTRSSIWLIADVAPSTTPMSSTCCSASADS